MNVILDCNVWVQAISRDGRLPKSAAELKKSELGSILNAALRGVKVEDEVMTIVISRHVVLTSDHVCARNGWTKSGEVSGWMRGLCAHLGQLGNVVFDDTREDYPALAARAAKDGGAEDAEDEAVLRSALANNAVLITEDWMFAGAAGRRGVRVLGPRALIDLIEGR